MSASTAAILLRDGWFDAARALSVLWNQPFTFVAPTTNSFSSPGYTVCASGNPSGLHHALDYAPPFGTPVYSVAAGTVELAGTAGTSSCESGSPWYGNFVRIRHAENYWSSYAHLRDVPTVTGNIPAATLLGYVGNTGQSCGSHLHLEIYKGGYSRCSPDDRQDPYSILHDKPFAGSPGVPIQKEEDHVFKLHRNPERGDSNFLTNAATWRHVEINNIDANAIFKVFGVSWGEDINSSQVDQLDRLRALVWPTDLVPRPVTNLSQTQINAIADAVIARMPR